MKVKKQLYSIFQFLSFFALILLFSVVICIAYVIVESGTHHSLRNAQEWYNTFVVLLKYERLQSVGVIGSVLLYVSAGVYIASWVVGWMVFRIKNRNLFDSLFLLFLMIPVICNIFTLFAQIAQKELITTTSYVDKKHIEKETTRLINIENLKLQQLEKERSKKRKIIIKETEKIENQKNKEVEKLKVIKTKEQEKAAELKKKVKLKKRENKLKNKQPA